MKLDDLIADIERLNREGVACFTNDVTVRCGGAEAPGALDYRAFAIIEHGRFAGVDFRPVAVRVARKSRGLLAAAREAGYRVVDAGGKASLEPAAVVRLSSQDFAEGETSELDGYLRGVAPDTVELPKLPAQVRPGARGVAVVKFEALPCASQVDLLIENEPAGRALLGGAWSFFIREWGIKELYFTAATLDPGAAARKKLATLWFGPGAGPVQLEGRYGVVPTVHATWRDSVLSLTTTALRVERRRRPQQNPAFRVLRRGGEVSGELNALITDLEPPLPVREAELVRLLETERDPAVAMQAAYLVGHHRLRGAAPALTACIEHPHEDALVVQNALWALVELGWREAVPVIEAAAHRHGDEALAALAALDAQRARRWMEARAAEHSALGRRCAGFLEAHPALARAAPAPVVSKHVGADLPGLPHCAAVHPRGTHFAVGAQRAVFIGELASPGSLERLESHSANVESLAFSPDGRWLAAAGGGGLVELWSLKTRTLEASWNRGKVLFSVVFSPDSATLGAVGSGQAWTWPVDSSKRATALAPPAQALAWTSRGELLGARGDAVLRYEGGKGAPFTGHAALRHLVVASGGELASVSRNKLVVLWSAGGELLAELAGHDATILSISAGQGVAASGDFAGRVVLWDLARRAARCSFAAHEGRLMGVALTPGGRWLVTVGLDDRRVEVWDVEAMAPGLASPAAGG